MTRNETIELRSEKIRNIIGKVPPKLVRNGTIYVTLLLLMIMLAVALIPYPENVTAEVSITDVNQSYIHAETLISYRYITQIKKGAVLQIEIEGYPSREFGYTSGVIASVEDSIVRHDGNNYFRALLSLKRSPKYDVYRNMQGIATITISDHSILQYILGNKSLH